MLQHSDTRADTWGGLLARSGLITRRLKACKWPGERRLATGAQAPRGHPILPHMPLCFAKVIRLRPTELRL
jgi:hypothetical protein